MRFMMRLWFGLCIGLWGALPATADSFGPWVFGPPDGYEREVVPQSVIYKGPRTTFRFYNPAGSQGKTPQQIGPDLIEEMLGAPPNLQQFMLAEKLDDGRDFALFLAGIDGEIRLVAVFVDGMQAGVVTVTPPQIDQFEDERAALLETEFHEQETVQPAKPSRLPAMDWPAPLANPVATTRPEISIRSAIEQGLDPEKAPLPVRFSCFREDEPRAMTATPDLEFTFAADGSYRVSNGQRSGGGKWWIEAHETFDYVVKVDGTMEFDSYFLMGSGNGYGQRFSTEDPYADDEVELTCHQDGPAVERVQQAMARVVADQLLMNCTDANGQPFRFMYGNGIYQAPEGSGRMHIDLEGDGDDWWRALFRFDTGPYSLYEGEMKADSTGALSLQIATEWSTGSIFYSSSETAVHAMCIGNKPARLLPEYGMDPAPPAAFPVGGLPEGVFRSFESHAYWSGGMYMYDWRDTLTYIAPNGRAVRDVEMDDLGGLPDCTRSRPDGYAYCGEYRVNGNTVSFRDAGESDEDDWSDPEIFISQDDGFRIDDVDYTPLQPIDPSALTGIWVGESYTGSGPGIGGGAGVYSDAEIYWSFGADGRFAWRESVTTTTLISPDPILGGVSGGGSSSSQDGGAGRYQFDGTWLSLTFDDGRSKRLFVLGDPPVESAEDSADPDTGPMIRLGGNNLKRG